MGGKNLKLQMDLTTDATVTPEALSKSSHACLLEMEVSGGSVLSQLISANGKLGVIVLLSPFDLERAKEGFMF